jgi:hypothetical protein
MTGNPIGNVGSLKMGYTHYWHRPQTVPDALWDSISSDFGKLVLPLSDAGVVLAGGLGTGPPEIN